MFKHAAKRHSCPCSKILKSVFQTDTGRFLSFVTLILKLRSAPEMHKSVGIS